MNVAFIPVRGGSKSIPLKNIKLMCGRPLVYWTIKAACECKYIDKVYVATDSKKIKDTINIYCKDIMFSKLEVIGRSNDSATDVASTEFAMLEFAKTYDFNNIVLIQATSPLLVSEDLNKGFETYNESNVDSVLSAVKQKRFNWNINDDGFAIANNYDIYNRPRRQEFDGYYVENGAFYITSRERLLNTGNRISGNIKIVEMDENSFFEIDEPSDWIIIEDLLKKQNDNVSKIDVSNIKMFLTDCDGCLTDAGMYYSENGDELKKFNTRDGVAFNLLKEKGIITGIITSENVELNRRRAEKLQINILEMSCKDKAKVIKKICQDYNIFLNQVVYVGDDINDLEVIKMVGYGCCPNDAIEKIKLASDYISCKNGGDGAIRDIVEHILK